jgi:hypothetical protein
LGKTTFKEPPARALLASKKKKVKPVTKVEKKVQKTYGIFHRPTHLVENYYRIPNKIWLVEVS